MVFSIIAPTNVALSNIASVKSAWDKSAPSKQAPVRFAPRKFASINTALSNCAPVASVFVKFVSDKYECFLLGKHTVERVCSGLSPLRRDRLWC